MPPKIISVKKDLATSKYKQIVNSVLESINEGRLNVGDRMPSINSICQTWGLSRDTVLSAYNELKAKGIISSMPGKGYYVETTNVNLTHKVFVLFDELNSFKEDLYNSFLSEMGGKVLVEIYFHHFNRKVFDNLLLENNGQYTTYVVMPAKFQNTAMLLNSISGRVIILDQLPGDLIESFPTIYQNFENDTYQALMSGKELLLKYKKLIMVYPGGKEPEGQFRGFVKYCHETQTPFELLSDLNDRSISKGEAYIAIWDRDLVKLVKYAKEEGLKIGEDIGIISYNDTALKQVVANGITTISTDFTAMGRTLAQLVQSKKNVQIENPSSLIVRGSL
jgi:DNA-binding GntR family transcriptional regulator